MNKVILIGRLTKDIEVKAVNENLTVATFSIAVNGYKDRVDFIRCQAFNNQALTMGQYLKKGNKIAIEGNIKTDSYDKDGVKHFTTMVNVDRFSFLDNKDIEEGKSPF